MAFNPISIDDEAVGIADVTPLDTLSTASPSGFLHHKIAPRAAVRRCQQRYYFEVQWQVPFPQQSAAPLLYYPAAYKDLLNNPAAVGVMQAELDGMAEGVLPQIPLAYYPLRPGCVHEARAAAKETERRTEELQRQARAAGQLERLTWRPEDVNPDLHPADIKLLDTDLDSSLVLQRDLPSLTLLQRPLYTDTGLVPAEERHTARLARIVPQELRNVSQTQGAAMLPGSPMSPGSPQGPGAASAFEQTDEKSWMYGVRRSFQRVRALDEQYAKFLGDLAHGKLGLDRDAVAHRAITRKLWSLLLEDTTNAQQRDAWHALCRFSCNYGDKPPSDAVRELMVTLTGLRLPQFSTAWQPLFSQYADALDKYVIALPGGMVERKEHLHFSGRELDSFHTGSFQPELTADKLVVRQGTNLGENHMPLPIYPVEVIPVFPSGFEEAARRGVTPANSECGALDFLAESAEDLHHVVLPGAVVTAAHQAGPHVLIGGSNLLVADADVQKAAIQDGDTVSYHTTRENTFESIYSDNTNTASYILRVCEHSHDLAQQSNGGGPSPANLKGAVSLDGRCITYDRVGWQDVYGKAANVELPRVSRHVLMYSNDALKRSRVDVNGVATAAERGDTSAMRRVKVEGQTTNQ